MFIFLFHDSIPFNLMNAYVEVGFSKGSLIIYNDYHICGNLCCAARHAMS